MGIKNLAFCVADVKISDSAPEEVAKNEGGAQTKMNIISWRRLDVVEEASSSMAKGTLKAEAIMNEVEVLDPYTPSALSSTAYTLLAHTLLPYKPEIILIERQRWRSAGGVAIQQWTVRVNTLEGMLWAILTALRGEGMVPDTAGQNFRPQDRNYAIFGVDPKRVGNFWIGENERGDALRATKLSVEDELIVGPEGEIEDMVVRKDRPSLKKLSRGKAEKKAKIQLLRSWLTPDSRSTVSHSPKKSKEERGGISPAIDFTFSPDAEATRLGLCSAEKAKGGRKSARTDIPELKKLDDVTDCFLQAAAWVAWEINRTKMVEDWDSEQGRLRSLDNENDGKKSQVTVGETKKKGTKAGGVRATISKLKDGSKL